MTDLSPQAQAVYDAYCEGADNPYSYDGGGLVAALRAAVMESLPRLNNGNDRKHYSLIMDIADELEQFDD